MKDTIRKLIENNCLFTYFIYLFIVCDRFFFIVCHTLFVQDPPCEGDFCSCTYVLEVDLGDTVELVLVDEGTLGASNHPFHIHGNNFHVVAMGRLGT